MTANITLEDIIANAPNPQRGRWDSIILKSTLILKYEDDLLKKERGIKYANLIVKALIGILLSMLVYFGWLMSEQSFKAASFDRFVDKAWTITTYVFILLLFYHINELQLKHIASIKLYRGESPNQRLESDARSSRL